MTITAFLEAAKAEPMNPSRIIMYARNAVKEIEELRDWVRAYGCHDDKCARRWGKNRTCSCGWDRIREIVGGGV